MRKIRVRNIAFYALLIALNVVLTRVASIRIGGGGTEIVRIGFGGLPVIFAGIIFGPLAGGIVGALGDIIGMIVSPMGPYMPHFTFTAALTGIIPGLVIRMFGEKISKTSFWKLVVAIGISQVITSIILIPLFMKVLFSIPFVVSLPGRLIGQVIHIPLYAYMIKLLANKLCVTIGLC